MCSTLSQEDIRAMDGPALTELAHQVGLAPDDVRAEYHFLKNAFLGCWSHNTNGESPEAWDPAENLPQADAVFRGLRERGWDTQTSWDVSQEQGDVCAGKMQANFLVFYGPKRHTEAHALLLVSVLAVASEENSND